MKDLIYTETKGDVSFWKDNKEKQYQKIGDGELLPIKKVKLNEFNEEVHTFKKIEECEEYNIRFNHNGVRGFGVFMGNKNLEDGIWTLEAARRCAKGMIYNNPKNWISTNPGGERL